jgi:uncharacterized repeat protein (TIGR02543 family)
LFSALNLKIRSWLPFVLVLSFFMGSPAELLTPRAQAATTVTLTDADKLQFLKSNANFSLSATKTAAGAGVAVNDIVIYKNVGSFGGISIDCAVTTVAINAGGSITNYDNNGSATTTGTYLENFQLNTAGGEATFKFEFFKAGTYTVPGSGVPVVLQNVKITSIDLDSSGTNGYQYTDFTGFQKYSMMSPTNLAAQPVTSPNRVRFIATKTGARSSVPEDQVLVKYDSVQTIQMSFGNVGGTNLTNYYGLVFGGWPGAGLPVEYTNLFNTPPTSSDVTLNVANNPTASGIPLSAFGNYADADNNPFNQVKIGTISGGTLEYSSNGSSWSTVSSNQVITVADIEAGKVRFTPTDANNGTVTFYVQDGLDYSLAAYTLTLDPSGAAQTITFANPGTKAVSGGSFASAATASSGLTVTLTSTTTGICTVSGFDIVPVAAGTCVITATQPGDANTPAALPVTQSFLITATVLQSQTLTLLLASPATNGTTVTPTASSTTNKITSSATSVNSLNVLTSLTPAICTVSAGVISYSAAGTCTIEATNAGDTTYGPATAVTASVTVEAPESTTQPIPTTLGTHTVNTTSATLTGMVDVNGVGTTYRFCYMKTSTFSTANSTLKSTSTGSAPSGVTCVNTASLNSSATPLAILSSNITGLSTRSTYYYNISAWNSSNVAQYGEVFKFTTWSTSKSSYKRPMVKTDAASSITNVDATLNGTGTKDDSSSSTALVSFCISTSPAFSSTTFSINCNVPGEPLIQISGTSINTSATAVLRNTNDVLSASTVYYYQASITRTYNGSNTTIYGNIVSFTTSAKTQDATTTDATNLTTTTAVLNGSVNGYGVATDTSFLISSANSVTSGALNTSPVTVSASPSSVSANSGVLITGNATGLTNGTRYYFQARATRDGGTTYVYGPVKTFITGTPSVKTLAPTNLSSTVNPWSVDLNGYVNPNGTTATLTFCYLTSGTAPTPGSDGSLSGCTSVSPISPNDTSTVTAAFTKNMTGLTAGATYYYQAVASAGGRTSYGEVLNFTTVAPPTAVTTTTPSAITSSGATLAGTATSNGAGTDGAFCVSASNDRDDNDWLKNCELGVQDNESTLATNASGAAITGTITGLSALTTYYYQATAASSVGTGLGAVASFTTLPGAPTPVTLGATGVTGSAARMNGTVNPGGADTTVKFNYITDSTEPTVNGSGKLTTAGSGTVITVTVSGTVLASASTTSIFYDLTGLSTSNLYYYQIEVTNSSGTAYGDVVSFSINDPYAVTGASESITSTTAIVKGTGYKAGSNAQDAELCLSASSDVDVNGGLSGCTSSTPVSLTAASHLLTLSLTGLNPGTTYYYQASATDNVTASTNYGAVASFTTLFVVTFDGNGSSDSMTAMSAITTTALTSNTYTRSGYTFAGWNTAADGSGTAYANGANYPFNANVTLYAQWTANAIPTPTPVYIPEPAPKTKPVIEWKNPNAIKTTTTLSTAQLNAIAKPNASSSNGIAGRYVYTPIVPTVVTSGVTQVTTITSVTTALTGTTTPVSTPPAGTAAAPVLNTGTTLAPGVHKLKVVFIPTDTNSYEPVETTVDILVQAETKVNWVDPAPIKKTEPLSPTQLNAKGTAPGVTENVPGTYKYDIPEGTKLAPGKHDIKVIFTPTDPNYLPSEGKVTITVTADINPLATPIVTPANTAAAKPITNTTSAATASIVKVGEGLSNAVTSGTQVSVLPNLNFSGKTSVTVKVNDEGETKEVEVPVTVLPLVAVAPTTKPSTAGSSTISWKASPNAVEYDVTLADKVICTTSKTSCATNALIGPKSEVEVIAKGNDQTVAEPVLAAYTAPKKPVTALVVYFDTNKFNLDAKDKADIQAIAKVIIEQGFKNVVVNGHTDVRGGVDNKVLSSNRAKATFNYLKELVPGLKVTIGAFASTKPAVKGNTPAALASNRRAEVGVF